MWFNEYKTLIKIILRAGEIAQSGKFYLVSMKTCVGAPGFML